MNLSRLINERRWLKYILSLIIFCCTTNASAQEVDKWQYEFTLYGWLPNIDGALKYSLPPGEGGSVSIDSSKILDSLDMTFMGTFEARYNKLSLSTDIIYLDLSNSKNKEVLVGQNPGVPFDAYVHVGITGWQISGIAGYDMIQTNRLRLAFIGGLRYFTLDADANLSLIGQGPLDPQTILSKSISLWDGIVGIRGAFMLNKNWYLPYYADIGAGDSDLTWQLFVGIGYQFNWGNIKLGYRYLKYDQDDDEFLQDFEFYGPILGVGFRF